MAEYCEGVAADRVMEVMLRDGQWYEVQPKTLRVDAYRILQASEPVKDGSKPLDLTWYGGIDTEPMTAGSLVHWDTPDGYVVHVPVNAICAYKSKGWA